MVSGFAPLAQQVHAADASKWQAGRIIDDVVFTDSGSMSVQQIQDFLNSKVGTGGYGRIPGQCDTWGVGISESGGGTRAQYGASKGNPAPFTCLKDYYEVPKLTPGPSLPANNYGGKPIPAGAKSAAQLIYDAAQTYNISPKVLLTTIQKESAGPLTTDDWPFLKQYTYAMGAHCPDGPTGAQCDPNYSGFSLQIAESAKLFRWYLDSMDQPWWSYRKPYATNFILWREQFTGCGGGNVYIENKATAALYTYTPYQPNQASLANMYGEGDACSSYGNRNFWRIYNDWFGPTIRSPFFTYDNKVYILGANNSYYYVPSQSLLTAYGLDSKFGGQISYVRSSFTTNMTYAGTLPWVARFEDNSIYAVDKTGLHHFEDPGTYFAYGYSFGSEAILPKYLMSSYDFSSPMKEMLQSTAGPAVYYVSAGIKQLIANEQTYNSLGTPSYNSRPLVRLSNEFVASVENGGPIMLPGSIVSETDTGRYYIYTNGTLQSITRDAYQTFGIAADFSAPNSLLSYLPSNQNYAGVYVSDSTGKKYMLDGGNKFLVSNEQSALFAGSPDFKLIGDDALSRFNSKVMTDILKKTGSPEVFLQNGGRLYHIFSEVDLIGLGLSFGNITNTSRDPSQIYSDTGSSVFKTGRLVKVAGKAPIYVVEGLTTIRHIPSEAMMSNYSYSFSNVAVVSDNNLSGYTQSSPLSQTVKDSSGNKFLIDSGCKRKFSDSLIAEYGKSTNDFIAINDSIINGVSNCADLTNLVRGYGQKSIFKIESGQKRWITNEQAFINNGFQWGNVTPLSLQLVNSIATGVPLN